MVKITNPEALPSCCLNCGNAKRGICKITKRGRKTVQQAQIDHPRCMYWDKVI